MKFRCERDVLVEALGTAGRAVTSRGGALPVLSRRPPRAHRRPAARSPAPTSTSRSRSTSTVAGEADGVAVLPARLAADIVRALRARQGRDRRSTATRRSITAGRSQFSVRTDPGRRVPAAGRAGRRRGHAAGRGRSARRCARSCAAASTDEARPILTGVLLAAEDGGLRLVATDSYRLAVRDLPGTGAAARARSVLVPSRALSELERLLGGAERGHAAPRRARRDVRGRRHDRLTTRLIEGEFPNYRRLIPASHPNRLTVGREAAARGGAAREAAGHATPHRCACDVRPTGLELDGHHPGRRPGPRGARRQVRGHRADRGVQPRVPRRRRRGRAAATRSRSRRSTRMKPAVLRSVGERRLPLPADARPGAREPARSPSLRRARPRLWLTDFRNYPTADVRASTPGSRRRRATTARARPTCSRHGLPGHARSFRGAPTEALVRVGADARRRAGRGGARRRARAARSRPSSCRGGRNRVQVNRQRLGRARDLLGVLRVTVFSPDDLDAGEGRPGERRRYLDDALVALHPQHDALRTELDRILRQRNALLKQAGGRLTTEVERRPSTCGTPSWPTVGEALGRRRRRAGRRPGAAASPRPTSSWPTGRPSVDAALRAAVARRRAGRRAGRGAPRRRAPRRDAWSARTATTLELVIGGLPARTHASQGEQRRWPWPCASPPTGWSTERGRQRRRCCCSTTCSPSSTPTAAHGPAAPPARRPGRAHHRRRAAARPRTRRGAACRGVARSRRDGRDPVPIGDSLQPRPVAARRADRRRSSSLDRSVRGRARRWPADRGVFGRLGRGRRRRGRRPRPAASRSTDGRWSSRSTTRPGRPSCGSSRRRSAGAARATVDRGRRGRRASRCGSAAAERPSRRRPAAATTHGPHSCHTRLVD